MTSSFFTVLETWPIILRDWILIPFPEFWHPAINAFLMALAILTVFGLGFAFITVSERKILGRFQNRPGPNRTGPYGLFQPFADAVKALTKEDIVPTAADKVLHFLAPVIVVAGTFMCFAVLPFGRNLVPVELDSAVLYFFAAGAMTELAIFMAGWSSNNKFSLLSGMRALAQLISYELPLILSIIPVIMVAGTLSTQQIVLAQGGGIHEWFILTPWGVPAFIIFLIAGIAEANRCPFDLPEGESEIIAGHLTEYSGFKYALFFMGEYFGLLALSGIAVTLFFGGWQSPIPALDPYVPTYLWFLGKIACFIFIFIWVRATLLRIRMDHLMRFSWKFLLPLCLINLGTTAFWELSASWQGFYLHGLRWIITLLLIIGPFVALGRGLSRKNGPRNYNYVS